MPNTRHLVPIAWLSLGAALLALVGVVWQAQAGGPLLVGGPNQGIEGQPILWDPAAMPVAYRTDGGPLSQKPDGTVVIANAAGVTRVQNMFQVWQDVPTSAISFVNAGPIQSAGTFTDGDVDTLSEFNEVEASCEADTQSPIIFDADAKLTMQLIGDPGVIGFAGPCDYDSATGHLRSGIAVLNGSFQDGIDSGSNYELTAAEFNQVFVHEFGHFIGLDHSQINVDVLNFQNFGNCSLQDLAGLPVMFPYLFCQARVTAGLPPLAPDDQAWISRLYPETASGPGQVPFTSAYGFIAGRVLFSDGVTQVSGVNVIARKSTDARRVAVSVASGYLVAGYLGQNVTGDSPPYPLGSHNAALIGTFEIPVPPGTYTVEVESIDPLFVGGSGIGPFGLPIPSPGPKEFWNSGESDTDSPSTSTVITVAAGQTVSGIDIILNGTPPRFDSFESARLWLRMPLPAILRRRDLPEEVRA